MTRTDGIGGSDVAAAIGIDPRKTPYQLWREKLGMDQGFAGSAATRRGNFLEAAILHRYVAEVQPAKFEPCVIHEHNWQRGNQDGRATMPDGQRRVVEAKSVSRHVFAREWGAPWSDEVPDRVLCQGLWYALLDGADLVDVPVCVVPDDPDQVLGVDAAGVLEMSEFFIFRVGRSRETEDRIVRAASNFWHHHVLAKIAPEPTTQGDVDLMWPRHIDGKVRVASEEALDLIRRYEALGADEKATKDDRDRVRMQLMAFAEDCEAIVDTDGRTPLLTLKAQERKAYTVEAGVSRVVRLTKWWNKINQKTPTQEIPK